MALAIALAAGGSASAGPTGARPSFCPVLKRLAADARDGFSAVRGRQIGLAWDDGGGDDEIRYATPARLPGAQNCDVALDHADGSDVLATYRCRFPARADKAAAVTRLAARVRRCLGRRPADRVTRGEGDTVAAADLDRPKYLIDLSARRAPGVTLEIGGK